MNRYWSYEDLIKISKRIDCYAYLKFNKQFYRDSDARLKKLEEKLKDKYDNRK